MVLDTSLYKVLPWLSIMLTILYIYGVYLFKCKISCFGIRIQKIVFYCLYILRTNYIRLNNLNIKQTIGPKISRFVIYIEAIIYLLW